MKAIFLIFHGFNEANGISKKIHYQVQALKDCGVDTKLCWLAEENGHKYRMIDNQIIQDYGRGIRGKILKRTALKCIYRYAITHDIELVYARSDHNTTPFLINLYRLLKKRNIKVIVEIPTYPYDQEYKDLPFSYQRVLLLDKCLRGFVSCYVDKYVTFSNDSVIFGRPTIRIANGIDFSVIPLKKETDCPKNELHFIAVATIHPWHGFDRAIRGLARYYENAPNCKVYLHIVGEGVPNVIHEYHQLAIESRIDDYVVFHGPLFGEKLDQVFNKCQLGIGSLARHRSGITHLRSLKNREYAARGIPFVYSEIDDDFEHKKYILKIAPDESPIDIQRLIDFYHSVKISPEEIRSSIEQTLSWKKQMQHIIDEV